MIRKFVKRCLLASLCMTLLGLLVSGCCLALASWSPGFYAAALNDPIDDADIVLATEEMEQTIAAIQLFLMAGPDHLERLRELPEENLKQLAGGKYVTPERLPAILAQLDQSVDAERGTFAASFTERQVNALMLEQFGDSSEELRDPRLSLEDGLVRLGVTVVTPVAEAVVSCDFRPVLSDRSTLALELHALRVGRLPLPARTLLDLVVQAGAKLPKGSHLDLAGARPTVTIDAKPRDAVLQVAELRVADGEVQLKVRRAGDAVVAAK